MTPGKDPSNVEGPLKGLRIIELGTLVAASFAARILGDFGAEVIKIEDPGQPDPLRAWGQGSVAQRGIWWTIQSRNKRLVTLDLRQAGGQEVFRKLCRTADVVIENFRPGTLEKWGVGPDVLAQVNSRLILARVSGFGQTGPYRHRPCFAALAEAMGGLRYINGEPDGPPLRMGVSLGDTLSGLFAVQGILLALHERAQSGAGQVVDIALTESCLAMLESSIAEYELLGKVRARTGARIPGVVPSNVFRTRDGKWFVIAASEARMFERLCVAMEFPSLSSDVRFATHESRCLNQDPLEQLIADWVATKDSRELATIMEVSDIAGGAVYSAADIVTDPQIVARGTLVVHQDEVMGSFLAQGATPLLSRTPGSVRWAGKWAPGADNQHVYGEIIGLTDQELVQLRASKIM